MGLSSYRALHKFHVNLSALWLTVKNRGRSESIRETLRSAQISLFAESPNPLNVLINLRGLNSVI